MNLSLNLKEVEFKNVGFSFNENGKGFEMKDLNFTIKKGEKIAIIGPSGAGKSTLVKLMLNFLKPQNGEIFINGIPVQNIRKKELRKKILYFPQEYFLFSDTILENVIFPEENKELSIVEEATKMTKIYQKISSLPEKFNTKLERNGSNFSGGERQRIVLSRLFVKKDWEILILDESFKEIDLSTENEVLQKILERYKDLTIIYITHRLNSIKNFDKIIFLKNGKIEGIGKHEDLMKNCEAYKKIFLKQGGKNDVELFNFYSGINK
ncbi:MAG: ABC transporter ATP-binding protein [candidate division WOR-3 bacterium]